MVEESKVHDENLLTLSQVIESEKGAAIAELKLELQGLPPMDSRIPYDKRLEKVKVHKETKYAWAHHCCYLWTKCELEKKTPDDYLDKEMATLGESLLAKFQS